MHDFVQAVINAIALVGSFDPEIVGIVALSLRVSLSASMIAMVIGAPMGGALAIVQVSRSASRHRARQRAAWAAAGRGRARSGPLGFAGLLFTPAAMVMAQTLLATPIVIALPRGLFLPLPRKSFDDRLWPAPAGRQDRLLGQCGHQGTAGRLPITAILDGNPLLGIFCARSLHKKRQLLGLKIVRGRPSSRLLLRYSLYRATRRGE
jgi:hypothetical protein